MEVIIINIAVPIEIVYVMAIVFAILTIIFLMGKGASLIAVPNIKVKEDKEKYKKLSKVIGIFFGVIDIHLIIISLTGNNLPEWFAYIFIAVIAVGVFAITILSCIDIIFKRQPTHSLNTKNQDEH